MARFKAVAICAMEMQDLDCFVVILAEHSDGSGARLEVQRALLFNEQDRSLGQDTYCLCTESGAVCYGGVVSWRLIDDALEIVLDAIAAKTLGVTGGYVIDIEANPELRSVLKDGLQRVLGTTSLPESAPE